MSNIFSYKRVVVVWFFAEFKKYVPVFLVLFTFWLFNSCREQAGNDERNSVQVDTSAVNQIVAQFDSLAWADSLFAKGEYSIKLNANDSTIFYFGQARRIYESLASRSDSSSWDRVIASISYLGEGYRMNANFPQAKSTLGEALEMSNRRFGNNSIQTAGVFHHMGNFYLTSTKLDSALLFYEKSIKIKKEKLGNESDEVAKTLGNVAIIYRQKGEFIEALKILERIIAILSKNREANLTMIGNCYNNMANIYLSMYKPNEAISHIETALVIYESMFDKSHPAIGLCYNKLGIAIGQKGLWDAAIEKFKIAEQILRDRPLQVGFVQNNIGQRLLERGDYSTAADYFRKSIVTFSAIEDKYIWLLAPYRYMGVLLSGQKKHLEALGLMKKAIVISETKLGSNHPEVGWTYQAAGDIALSMDDFKQAKSYFRKANSIFLRVFGKGNNATANSYFSLGVASQNNFYSAEKYFLNARDIFIKNSGGKNSFIAACYKNMGDLNNRYNKVEMALNFYHKAVLAILPEFNDDSQYMTPKNFNAYSKIELLKAMTSKVNCLNLILNRKPNHPFAKSSLTASIDYAMALADSIRIDYQSESAKFSIISETKGLYEKAIALYSGLQRPDLRNSAKSFAALEKNKSAVLLENINLNKAVQIQGIPDSLQKKERNFRRELNYLETSLQKREYEQASLDSTQVANMKNRLFNLKRDYEALKKQLETDYPEYHNLKYNTKVATVPEVQAVLDENTLLLEYFYGDSAIYIFALDKGGLEIVTVKKDQRLDQQIQAFRKAIIESDYALFVEKARTLYQTLLAPVAHQLGEKHLLIIPDGPLNYLPFEALLTKDVNGSEMDFSNVPYLLKERSVSYHYSATLWLETTLRKREKEPSYDYVAFAPVNWDSTVASNAVFATLTANRALDSTRALPVNLLSTRKEVLDIEAQFNEKYNLFASLLNRLGGNKTRVFLDHEATEAAAKHYNLEDYRYIHFATHGFANTAAPTLSGLLLADQRDSTASEDGVLRLGEIYNLALNADLVILSACETGYGKLSRGEGLLSLTRGFIYAGAKNLVVSLWQVDANSPSELIPMFFKGVLKGEAKNAALRNAKLALIKSGSVYAEPKHWAPFVLIGQ